VTALPPRRVQGHEEGFTLIEALLVVGIFSIIALALAGLFQTARTGFDVAATQAFVQRTGTAVVEQMQREFTTAAALQIQNCGPQSTMGKAVIYMTSLGNTRCVYEWSYTGDPGPQLYRCTLASWTMGGACTNTPENLLAIQNALDAPGKAAKQLVAKNIFFQSVSSLPNTTGNAPDPGRQVVTPLVDFRFDLDIPGVVFAASDSFPGQRFTASFTTRN
jgi:Tfp pilus assembly protein PilV